MARTSIILGVVALALFAFIMFFERGSLSTHEREGRKGRILETFVRDRVTRIELQRKGVTTVLTKQEAKPDDLMDPGGWSIEQPYAARADRDAVDSLLGALEWITPRRSLGKASASDLASFGLDKPRYRVTFNAGRERHSFAIGAASGDGTGAYLLTPNDGLAYVVGKDLVEALEHEPADFHTKDLHEGLSAVTVQKIRLRGGLATGPGALNEGERVLEKRGELFWITKPTVLLGSEPATTELVNALDSLRASRFVVTKPTSSSEYGLDAPRFEIGIDSKEYDIKLKGDDKVKDKTKLVQLVLRVGGPCEGHKDELFVRVDEGPVMCATEADLKKLDKFANDLRERRLLVLDDMAIRSVDIRAGKQQLVLEEAEGDAHRFRVLEGGKELRKGNVDASALADWFKELRAVTAQAYDVADTGAGLAPPAVTASFGRGKDGGAAYEVQLGRIDGEQIAAKRANEDTVGWYPLRALELLSTSAARFRKAKLLEEPTGGWLKLQLTSSRGSETVSKTGERYRLEASALAAPEAEPERSTVDEIVRLVSGLEVVRFVADDARPEHGLSKPSYTLRLDYAAESGKPARSHTLKIGAAADGGQYAQLDADPAVFVVAPALLRQLEPPLLSRAALSAPLEELRSVTLQQGNERVKIEAQEQGGFKLAGAGAPEPERAERIARAVATLRASGVVRYGKATPDEGIDRPQLRLDITSKGPSGTLERSVLIGTPSSPDPDADLHARRSDLEASFQLPASALKDLQAAAAP